MSKDLLAALLIGFIGSSHCLVMCGGIAGALQLAMPSKSQTTRFMYQLLLSLGRLTTYSLIGAAVGYFGASAMQLAGGSLIWLRLLAGIMLLLMALYISRLWMGLVFLERGGARLWQKIQPLSKALIPLNSPFKAYAYGLCWGALPCGLVYSSLSWSLASGSAVHGGLIMLCFGLGTLPAILLTGQAAALLHKIKSSPVLRYGAAMLLAVYAIYTIWLAIRRLVS